MRLDIVTVVTMKVTVLLVVTLCSLGHVRKVSCFYLQDRATFRKVEAQDHSDSVILIHHLAVVRIHHLAES